MFILFLVDAITLTNKIAKIITAPKAEKNKNRLQYFVERGPKMSFIYISILYKKYFKIQNP
jgi:hypothetical protein